MERSQKTRSGEVVDLFAGPGGWDLGLRALGHDALGLESEPEVCASRSAAGLRTEQADVAALDPLAFAPCWGLIASPPCQSFSAAGSRKGISDQSAVYACALDLARGHDSRSEAPVADARSLLVLEPLRWALALRPEWLALEQVPDVLGLWRLLAALLEAAGYNCWAGELNAANYGVPQTRRRAFLLAHRLRPVYPPEPTHAREPGEGLFGSRLPWVSMAEALGWGMTERPYPTIACSRESGGPDIEKVGGSGARASLYAERESGRWAWTLPATTVAGDPRITARAHHYHGEQGTNAKTTEQVRAGDYEGTEPIRLSLEEAALLQGFPADYPWQGNKSERFRQIGNAVPPLLAEAVLRGLVS